MLFSALSDFFSPLAGYWWIFLIIMSALLVVVIILLVIIIVTGRHGVRKRKEIDNVYESEIEDLSNKIDNQSERAKVVNDLYLELLVENEALEEENANLNAELNKLLGIDKPQIKTVEENELDAAAPEPKGSEKLSYTVKYDRPKNSWIIVKKGQERVTRRVATKVEALKIAKELSAKYDAALTIHKKDGKFQKQ